MACFHPFRAWRTKAGIKLHKEPPDGKFVQLPCGNCLGCRTARAQEWALRCQLELQDHAQAVFATLTYDDEHLPRTLQKEHVSAFLKSLRKRTKEKLRFFASGEYGERTQRAHYHSIIYGASLQDTGLIEKSWRHGHARVEPATPANIAYTAGYCSKKIGYKQHGTERLDPATGELYDWQPPFVLMSRNPGIGASAKRYHNAWRLYAVKDGHKMTVPRYYKDYYRLNATPEELEQRENEIDKLNMRIRTREELNAAEEIAQARQRLQSEKRNKL